LDQLPVKRYSDRDPELFSPAWIPESRSREIAQYDPDIVHLHWITGGFLQPKTLAKIEQPIVWTIHDMWPFTGGCHYSKSCKKYRAECSACPHLGSEQPDDLANSVWQRKMSAWNDLDINIVSPSQWLAEEARKSNLLGDKTIHIIPNCIDVNTFKPRSRSRGIHRFGLDENKTYILFGSEYETPRKGGDLLRKALFQLQDTDLVALVFGNSDIRSDQFPVPIHDLGRISDQDLRFLYSTADITIVPSREDNLPNIAVESLTSGTPCVAFDQGGMSDIIDHKQTGYLAKPFDTIDLAEGIRWITADDDRRRQLSRKAREQGVKKYSMKTVVSKYVSIYRDVVSHH
jgi:glycosyltransferase involved in cell wall biosynthesis